MTVADLCVLVAGVALVMTMPSRTALGLPPTFTCRRSCFWVMIGGLRLTVGLGLVLALVVLFRHGRYGGRSGPPNGCALGLASLGLLDVVPKLD